MIFSGLPHGSAKVILADPPWTFAVRSKKGEGRTPQAHYDTMTLDDIAALPVASLAAKDAVLLMWAVDPLFDKAFDIIKVWGFTYKTKALTWVKTNADGSPFTGMGYWTRANSEDLLLATRGNPKRVFKDVRRLLQGEDPTLYSRRREHSRKPDEQYDRIERLLPGPYVELFARHRRPGWSSWGNQLPADDIDDIC